MIHLSGIRQNNLKGFDLDLPTGSLIVITGLSGSGKSSLAFDTLYAEGQRRYVETFTPYARQFFDRMDKPKVDRVEGIPPSIAIEQTNTVRSTRSTVGTLTEICDYMKVLWPGISKVICPSCGAVVTRDHPLSLWTKILEELSGRDLLITFSTALSERLDWDATRQIIQEQGFQRGLRFDGSTATPTRFDDDGWETYVASTDRIQVIQDRIRISANRRARFIESAEQAFQFGKGSIEIFVESDTRTTYEHFGVFSNKRRCDACDLDFREPTPSLFSFNSAVGACSKCNGFGRVIRIDYRRAIPNPQLTLNQGAIKPWRSGVGMEMQRDLTRVCKKYAISMDTPFDQLPEASRKFILEGDPEYGHGAKNQWPNRWYGVKGYFDWLEARTYKMHVRVQLARYRAYVPCPECSGKRLKSDALVFQVQDASTGEWKDLSSIYKLSVSEARRFVESSAPKPRSGRRQDSLSIATAEALSRLKYLEQAGLGYLTLDRPTRTLSGGETERVNLTRILGSKLVNTLYVLDEPTVGLHPRDTDRLVTIIEELRDIGNTVVVVEHEARVIRAADRILDIGPGHGETGGEVVFEGSYAQLKKSRKSLTAGYLNGERNVADRVARPVSKSKTPFLRLKGVHAFNINDQAAEFPVGRLTALTGVSGSGKSALAKYGLYRAVTAKLGLEWNDDSAPDVEDESSIDDFSDSMADIPSIEGMDSIQSIALVDQSSLGKTPRSNPAVFLGAFEQIRELFARGPEAKRRGLSAGAFSFNSPQGQCERCKGMGFEKIDMQFLSDVFVKCPACDGRRFRENILEINLQSGAHHWNISRLLEATIDEGIDFIQGLEPSRRAEKAIFALETAQRIGLGYLAMGQAINTLSGGECQRLKLARRLIESHKSGADHETLFLFDEPTTGLHLDDVRTLIKVLDQLVQDGHTVVVIEHNTDVITAADWIIDMGPEGGDQGGQVVFSGTLKELVKVKNNHTANALRAEVAFR